MRTIIIRQNTTIALIGLRSGLEKSLVGQTDRESERGQLGVK